MKNPLKDFDWSFKSIAKVVGIIVLGLVALSVAAGLIGFAFRIVFNPNGGVPYATKSMGGAGYDMAYDGAANYAMEESMAPSGRIGIMPPSPDYAPGEDAEEYEVKYFNGSVRTRKLDDTCAKIEALKAKDYVIFENSDKNKANCYYSFKVRKENEKEVLAVIESLKPESLNANIQSIKGSLDYYEDELSIQEKKLAEIEKTLTEAQSAYDDIQALATRQNDAETLAKIIDSKLNLIERLSNERLMVKEQIDRWNQSKADQLDRLNYTFFNVNVYKDVIFDWKNVRDDWRYEMKLLIENINNVFQGLSLQLVAYLIRFVQGVIYFLIAIFFIKWTWKGAKAVWTGNYGFKKKR